MERTLPASTASTSWESDVSWTPRNNSHDCRGHAYSLPCALAVLRAAVWLVEEHQIDVFQLRQGKTLIDRRLGLVVADIEDLGSEENLVPWDSGCSNRFPAAGFILVHCCRVDLSLLSID